MAGQTPPAHRTDDIRQSLDRLTQSKPFRSIIFALILLCSAALLAQTFGLGGPVDVGLERLITWCTALFTAEVCLRMLAQRVGFLGNAGNVATFLIVGFALFTPFDSVLLLRLFALLALAGRNRLIPRPGIALMTAAWLIVCIPSAAKDYVQFFGETCTGWADCLDKAREISQRNNSALTKNGVEYLLETRLIQA